MGGELGWVLGRITSKAVFLSIDHIQCTTGSLLLSQGNVAVRDKGPSSLLFLADHFRGRTLAPAVTNPVLNFIRNRLHSTQRQNRNDQVRLRVAIRPFARR
jgi:hypothetical protein